MKEDPQALVAFTVSVAVDEVALLNFTFTELVFVGPRKIAPPEIAHVYDVAPGTAATEYATLDALLQTLFGPEIGPGCSGAEDTVRQV